jgi:hypothetical protein
MQKSQDGRFPTDSSDIVHPIASRVTKIRSALRHAQPTGAGSANILRTMYSKRRRIKGFVRRVQIENLGLDVSAA